MKMSFLCFGGTSLSASQAHFGIFRKAAATSSQVQVRHITVAKLLEESAVLLTTEWESLGKSFSSRVAASNDHLTQASVQPVLEALHHLCALGPSLTPEHCGASLDHDKARRVLSEEASNACKSQVSIPYSEALDLWQKYELITKLKTELSAQLTWMQRDLSDQQAEKQRCEEELRITQDKYALLEANMRAESARVTDATEEQRAHMAPVPSLDTKAAVHISKAAEAYPLTTTGAWSDEVKACENDIKKVYQQHLRQLEADLTKSNFRIMELQGEVSKVQRRMERHEEEKARHLKEMSLIDKKQDSAQIEVDEMKESYDKQIQILSEHLCTLTDNLSTKDATLAEIQAGEVCCSQCGSWNKIGTVFASRACQHCQQALLRI